MGIIAEHDKKGDTIHLVSFLLADEEYGINIKRVKEIIKMVKITHVPQVKEYIEGVINLRGDVIPVMDLRKKFGLPTNSTDKEKMRIMIVEARQRVVGMIVNSVYEVLRLPIDVIEPPPDSKRVYREFLKGVANMGNRLVILLDLDRLLNS